MSDTQTQSLQGSVKRIRAIKNLVYQGKAIRGRRRTRIDGQLGAYDIIETAGEELECDQAFAREVLNSAKAELLCGGYVEVIPQEDGFPIYKSWNKNASDPDPVYERCELLRPLYMGEGCHLPAGTKIRMDVRVWDRSRYCYSDETQQAQHMVRIMTSSPKKVKLNAIEQATKVNALWDKVFPAATA